MIQVPRLTFSFILSYIELEWWLVCQLLYICVESWDLSMGGREKVEEGKGGRRREKRGGEELGRGKGKDEYEYGNG